MKKFKLKLALVAFLCFAAGAAPAAQAPSVPAYSNPMQAGQHAEAPLDRPNIETTELLPWASDIATSALRLDPSDYKDTLKKIAPSFTKSGWAEFTRMLTKDGIIDGLNQGMYVVVTIGTPVLLSEGVDDGRYRWSISMPARLEYTNPNTTDAHDQDTVINVVVTRVPVTDNVLGIQLSSWQTPEQ